jgi:hypothetical protein
LGLAAASFRGKEVGSEAVPSGQDFERAVIFRLDRLEGALQVVMLSSARTPPSGRLKMLSLVGDGG